MVVDFRARLITRVRYSGSLKEDCLSGRRDGGFDGRVLVRRIMELDLT